VTKTISVTVTEDDEEKARGLAFAEAEDIAYSDKLLTEAESTDIELIEDGKD
jgi:hypothetical protein